MEYVRAYLSHAGFIPSVTLVLIFYALLRGLRNSMWRIALLSLPGTIAHELAHFIVGTLLLAKPRGFSIWPRAHGDTWRLGSVSFGNIGLLNGAFVALAPLLLLPIAWLCVGAVTHFEPTPDLERHGWRSRRPLADAIHLERY